jgi:uncharacterized integral membrane protein
MLRTLLFLPFLIVLVAFALSNPQPVQLKIWPFDFYTLEAPLSIAILASAGVFFFLGALFVWFGSVAARGRAGRAERRAAALEAELKARTAPPPMTRRARPTVPALAGPK